MENLGRRRKRKKSIGRITVSVVCVCFAHFAIYLISFFFTFANIITLLFLSAIVLIAIAVIGRRCKRLFGLRGSAPAFVFTNLFFIWFVYLLVIHQAVSSLLDIIFHAELIMLHIGLYRILSGDPGFVNCEPLANTETYLEGSELPTSDIIEGCPTVESSLLLQRVRYCKHCEAHVKGFDHHCPTFGNCIGQNNHQLFMILLAGFIIAEVCYILGASKISYVTASRTLDNSVRKVGWTEKLATSTMVFSLLQVLWQLNWKKYPEFQHIVDPQPGEAFITTRFINPYDKGIWQNLREFIEAKG